MAAPFGCPAKKTHSVGGAQPSVPMLDKTRLEQLKLPKIFTDSAGDSTVLICVYVEVGVGIL
jgi:hypothetical protein